MIISIFICSLIIWLNYDYWLINSKTLSKIGFGKFPFDTQTCPIAIGGLGVRSSEVEFILENQNITEKGSSTEYEIKAEILNEETLETIFNSFPRMGF